MNAPKITEINNELHSLAAEAIKIEERRKALFAEYATAYADELAPGDLILEKTKDRELILKVELIFPQLVTIDKVSSWVPAIHAVVKEKIKGELLDVGDAERLYYNGSPYEGELKGVKTWVKM